MYSLLAFTLGVAHVVLYSHLFSPLRVLLCAVVAACLYLWRKHLAWRLLAVFLLGMAVGSQSLTLRVAAQVAPAVEGSDWRVRFTVVSLPVVQGDATRFVARINDLHCSDAECPALNDRRVRLSWYQPHATIKAGQVWEARSRLKRPRGSVNPGGFDYQAWLLSQRIVATGYIKEDAAQIGVRRNLAYWRQSLRDDLLRADAPPRFARFFAALIVGDKSAITADDWQLLRLTGTVHLMAVSGLHVGMVALWGLALGGLCSRVIGAVAPLWQVRAGFYPHALIACASAAGYAALAGFSVPTLRALAACVVAQLCLIAGARLSPATVVVLCAAFVVMIEPMAWISQGFWLSFSAVGILIYCFSGRRGGRRWQTLVKMQLVLGLGMLLPLLLLGQPTSLASPLANLLAVPLLSLAVIPPLLLAVVLYPFSSELALKLVAWVDVPFGLTWDLLNTIGTGLGVYWWPHHPMPGWLVGLCCLAVVMLLSPRGLGIRGPGAVILAVGLLAYQPQLPPLRMTVLDVGQGLSVVWRMGAETWVYDTGPRYSEDFDAGSRIVLPYLYRHGVHDLSLVISHNDLDHSGGLEALVRELRLTRLVAGEPVNAEDIEANLCRAGQRWRAGDTSIRVVWPPLPGVWRGNHSSCVLLLEWSGGGDKTRILLTGDIDKRAEYYLMTQLREPVDVLVAPHHGSKTSSSALFVNHFAPRWVIFSAGYRNRYNHPHPDVTARYRRAGSTMLSTAEHGAVTFTWEVGQPLSVEKARIDRGRPWFVEAPVSPAATKARDAE